MRRGLVWQVSPPPPPPAPPPPPLSRSGSLVEKSTQPIYYTACEDDPESCNCLAQRDPNFCGTCPDCGDCVDYCGEMGHGACDTDPTSCACAMARDSNFCNTCESLGGAGCGTCEEDCTGRYAKRLGLAGLPPAPPPPPHRDA